MTNQDAIGRVCILPDRAVGIIKATTITGNYWVKVANRYVLAPIDKCVVKDRHILPEDPWWSVQAGGQG